MFTYRHTMYASFTGYIVQAIINNFVPLLFLTFQRFYDIPLAHITFLVTFNFGVQLLTDTVAITFIDKIGYKVSIVLAHLFAALGLILLVILPDTLNDPFIGLMIGVMVYAIGGGLLEVLISPIVEACPTNNKDKAMSLLHSFYCWGHVGVVLLSTIFFAFFGTESWQILALIWAIVPIINMLFFMLVPVNSLDESTGESISLLALFRNKTFYIMLILMICAGASEQAVSQWSSTFSELALGLPKVLGDLVGPMFFAIMMGTSRLLYGKYGEKVDLSKTMLYSGILCMVSYLILVFPPHPIASILACGMAGFSVGILWPGTFSLSAKQIRGGGTTMFALLALAGDIGCSLGPTVVGRVSSMFSDTLRIGILVALIFPVILLIMLYFNRHKSDI